MSIKVKAIRTGFYGGQLRIPETPSESFEIKNKKEMGDWMIEDKTPDTDGSGGAEGDAGDLV